jgi:hypothetical protein
MIITVYFILSTFVVIKYLERKHCLMNDTQKGTECIMRYMCINSFWYDTLEHYIATEQGVAAYGSMFMISFLLALVTGLLYIMFGPLIIASDSVTLFPLLRACLYIEGSIMLFIYGVTGFFMCLYSSIKIWRVKRKYRQLYQNDDIVMEFMKSEDFDLEKEYQNLNKHEETPEANPEAQGKMDAIRNRKREQKNAYFGLNLPMVGEDKAVEAELESILGNNKSNV